MIEIYSTKDRIAPTAKETSLLPDDVSWRIFTCIPRLFDVKTVSFRPYASYTAMNPYLSLQSGKSTRISFIVPPRKTPSGISFSPIDR